MLTCVKVHNVTAFDELKADFSSGLNVLIGENGTGKTHLMKLLYSVYEVAGGKETMSIRQKLEENFLPDSIGRLVRRARGRKSGSFEVFRTDEGVDRSLSVRLTSMDGVTTTSMDWKSDSAGQAVYIPVKDMLANAPGFQSLYNGHAIHFEGVYADIISKALYPAARGRRNSIQKELLELIESEMSGTVATEGEEFYLRATDGSGNLEFTLLSEGYRKLGLLFCLVQNEMLTKGSVLFWDEPEANLNPKMMEPVVKILYRLVDLGVQVFVATHNSMLTSQIRLWEDEAPTKYHLFKKGDAGGVDYFSYDRLEDIVANPIQDAYEALLLRQIEAELNL